MNPRYNCIVPNCKVSADQTIPKFRFPYNAGLGEKWLNLVCNPILRNIPYREIRDRRFKVCAEHFAENTSYPTSLSRTLLSGVLPTLKLPDSRNWEPIYVHNKEIDLKNEEDDTKIDNAFVGEFSSSFTYSDSSSILNIKDSQLPIRGRGDSLKVKESGCKEKNNRRKYSRKKTVRREPREGDMSSGSDWEVEIVQGVTKRRKKPRLDLTDEDFESVEEITDLKIERVECNSDNENGTDYEGFEEIPSDDSAIETRSMFRNVYSAKGRNNEKVNKYNFGEAIRDSSIGNASREATNKEEIIEYTFGEAEHDSSTETAPILRKSSRQEANKEQLIEYTFGEVQHDSSKETAPRKETIKEEIIEYTFGEGNKDSLIETTPSLRKSSRQEAIKKKVIKYSFSDADHDSLIVETTPNLRKSSRKKANKETRTKENKETRKKENKETIKKAIEEKKISEYIFGETERAELIDVEREVYDTEKKKIKRQIYKTTLKFKRNNLENGKTVEEVFIIEHTFKSTCRKCPNHENDSVSCTMKKMK